MSGSTERQDQESHGAQVGREGSAESQVSDRAEDQKPLKDRLSYHTRNYFTASAFASVISSSSFLIFTYFLTLEEYGYISIFNTLITVFFLLYLLNTHSGVTRIQLDDRADWDVLLGANLLFVGAWASALMIALWVWADDLCLYFNVPPVIMYWAMAIAALQCSYQYFMLYLSSDQQSKRHSKLSISKRIGSALGAITLILLFTQDRYLGKIYAEAAVSLVIGGYCLYELSKLASFKLAGRPWRRYLSESLRYGLPLIPHTLSRYILSYFDQLQINKILGGEDTGRYSFAANIAIFMGFVITAAGRAWQPIFIRLYRAASYDEIEELLKPHRDRILLIACLISLYVGDLIYLIVPERYHSGVPLIPIIILGYVAVFLYTLYFQYSSYYKRTELISIATLLAGALNIALNAHYIPIYGYQAAAYTTLASYVALLALHYCNARLILRARVINWRSLTPHVSLAALVTLSASYLYTLSIPENAWWLYSVKLTLMGVCVWAYLDWRSLIAKVSAKVSAKMMGRLRR